MHHWKAVIRLLIELYATSYASTAPDASAALLDVLRKTQYPDSMIQSFADRITAAIFAGLEGIMSISIHDLTNTDFSDITTGNPLDPVTPGAILLHDFIEPLGLSANALANALHVPANRITSILSATRGITADTALRLARYFGTTPQFWMNLQRNYDLRLAEAKVGARIREEIAARPVVG